MSTVTIHLPTAVTDALLRAHGWVRSNDQWVSPEGALYWMTDEALTVALSDDVARTSPVVCPNCGGDDISVFAASEDREDMADLAECNACHWTKALTPEGAQSLASVTAPRILATGEHVDVVIGGCTIGVHAQQDADGGDFLQLIGRDCNLTGEEPGLYYPEKFTPPHERRGGNGAS